MFGFSLGSRIIRTNDNAANGSTVATNVQTYVITQVRKHTLTHTHIYNVAGDRELRGTEKSKMCFQRFQSPCLDSESSVFKVSPRCAAPCILPPRWWKKPMSYTPLSPPRPSSHKLRRELLSLYLGSNTSHSSVYHLPVVSAEWTFLGVTPKAVLEI